VDLCRRVWNEGYTIQYTPEVRITHLGGQSVKRMRTRFAIETHRSLYRISTNIMVSVGRVGKEAFGHFGLPQTRASIRQYLCGRVRTPARNWRDTKL
jgi:GT2 family glycosyltransferase